MAESEGIPRTVDRTTLQAEDTSAAIVVGWRIDQRELSCTPGRVEALVQTLMSGLATRGHALALFVPGDTRYPDSDVYGSFVLGREVVLVEANDLDPAPIDPAAVRAALAALPRLDAEFWRETLAFIREVEPPGPPGAYLLSWGPLCYGTICAGVAATREKPDEDDDDESEAQDEPTFVHAFIANQDMAQEWSESGIDGVHLQNVEFSDLEPVDLDPARLAAAAGLAGASFWLLCRYD